MAKMSEYGCKIVDIRNHTMKAVTTPCFSQNFRADMNGIGATWGNVGGQGSWIFKPEFLAYVKDAVARNYPLIAAVESQSVAEPTRTPAEQFAVAMGLGIIAEEDLS